MLNPHRAMDWVLLFVRTVSVVFSEDIHFDAFLFYLAVGRSAVICL